MYPLEDWEILDLMQALIEKSLVDYEMDANGIRRYRLLESVREYAIAQHQGTVEGTIDYRNQHLHYFLSLAEETLAHQQGPEQAFWLDKLEAEYDNLRTALDYALGLRPTYERTLKSSVAAPTPNAPHEALRLAAALIPLWQVRGYFNEGRAYLNMALALPEEQDTDSLRIHLLNGAGILARFQGDYTNARHHHLQSLRLATERGFQERQAETLLCLTTLDYFYMEDAEAARQHLMAALQVTSTLGDGFLNATAQHRMGMVATEAGDWDMARACFADSRRQWAAMDNRIGVAEVEMWQGWLATRQRDFPAARIRLRSALLPFHALRDRLHLAMLFFGYADLACEEGHHERAAHLWGIVHTLVQELGAAIPPRFRAAYERHITALRIVLGDEAFDSAFAIGQFMPLEAAIETMLQSK